MFELGVKRSEQSHSLPGFLTVESLTSIVHVVLFSARVAYLAYARVAYLAYVRVALHGGVWTLSVSTVVLFSDSVADLGDVRVALHRGVRTLEC